MARKLQPCGTFAAYRRHLRAKETPCDACRQAARDQKNDRKNAQRVKDAEAARDAAPPVEEVDRRQILLEVLASLRGQLREAPPQSVASIAKQIRDTVDALEGPEDVKAAVPVNPVDEIARRRKERAKKWADTKRIATPHS